ncbi:TSUP family transporter [Paenibacillus sp. TRM 82003]|nr:TSUP family transporter [Paenibacillus sp. TRM 82003]
MESIALETLLFLIAAGFLAAFIDSVVGGGGLISMPALLLTGLPPGVVLGTNKLGGTASSMTSAIQFLRSGNIEKRLAFALFPLSFVGSALGSYTVTLLPSAFLKPLVVILLIVVTIYTIFKKNWGKDAVYRGITTARRWLIAVAAFVIGYYDGFFGPGTGSFLLFAFLLLGFDFVRAAGNARLLNFASNIASLLTFLAFGLVNFAYGIPMALAMVAGAFVGSRFAIKRGAAFVKPLFIGVTSLLIGKQLFDLVLR